MFEIMDKESQEAVIKVIGVGGCVAVASKK